MSVTDHTINIKVKGEKETSAAANAAKKLGKEVGTANAGAGKLKGGMAGLSSAMAKGALAFGAIAAAAAASVRAFAEVDAARGRLQNAFQSAGGTTKDYEDALNLAADASAKYGIRTLDSLDALRKLADASGDAAKAQKDYTLALDISAQANIGLSQATDILAKVRNGDVRSLKELRGVNKDLATDLGKIEDETLRAELAMRLLSEAYDGSAEANAGLIDKQASLKSQTEDLKVAFGEMIVSLGTAGSGMIGSFLELTGVVEKGDEWIKTFAGSFKNFAGAVTEAGAEVNKIVRGIRGIMSGKSVFEVISEEDTRIAQERAEKQTKFAEKAAEKAKVAAESTTKSEITEAIKQQENQKKSQAARKKGRDNSARDAERARQDEERALADWWKSQQEKFKDEEDRAFRDRMARLKMQGEMRAALVAEMENSGATAGEIELATSTFDADTAKRAQEIEQREEIARLTLEGKTAEAERLAIMANANLTPLEKEVQLKGADARTEQERIALALEYGHAFKAASTGVMEMLGMQDEAKRLGAAQDAIIMAFQAYQQWGLMNYPGAIALGIGAAKAAAFAGSGGSDTPSGGGGAKSPTASSVPSASDADRLNPTTIAEPRDTSMTVNVNTLSYVSPEDARRIGQAEAREATSTVGGRK